MKFQTPGYSSCGSCAVDNALECYGETGYTERATMRLCRTTKKGTGERGIREALQKRGHKNRAWNTINREQAIEKLFSAILCGWPVILAVDKDDHWVTVIGVLGEEVIIADPENTPLNRQKNGIHHYLKAKLLRRWKNKKSKYYGLMVFPRKFKE